MAALLVFAIITGTLFLINRQRMNQLVEERAAEAQRILDFKQSHYRVRERSGYHDLIKNMPRNTASAPPSSPPSSSVRAAMTRALSAV